VKSKVGTYIAGAALLLTSGASYADQYVIAHSGLSVTSVEVKDIYLGEKQFAGSVKLVPLDNTSAQERFLASVLKLDQPRYTSLRTREAFREGLNKPSMKLTDNEIVEFVKRTPGALGYVSANPVGVTIIQKF
jgi:hypothetical protein